MAHLEGLIAALGLVFVGWQIRLQTRAEKEGLTHAYLSRYWEIDDCVRSPGIPEHELNYHLARYLRLTEDEFEAARLGWLPTHRWEVWHEWLCDDRFRDELSTRVDTVGPPEGECMHLRRCLGVGQAHTWADCPSFSKPRTRWMRLRTPRR
ncbi:hypothetical protein BJF82_04905 [Kytococcus sp. CUA-901]|nr:hypothetical protein BJF82_04905 [Kytococcus sp. CUA-901]